MEIVHIVRQYRPSVGGLEDAVQNLCAHLGRVKNVKVRIVTLDRLYTNPDTVLPKREVIDGIDVTRIPYFGSKRYPLAFGILKEIQSADIVHVHAIDFFYDFLAWTKFLHRKPLVVSTHGGFFHSAFAQRMKKFYFQTVTRLSALAYHTFCTSSENDARTFSKIAASKIVTIENGVNIDKWRDRASAKPVRTMISVGRWSDNKATPVLVELIAELKKQNTIWNLIIVGIPGAETKESLESLARRLGVETQVQIHQGPSEQDIGDLMGKASFFVSASRYEGFGISAVEGLSAGLMPLLSPIPPFEKLCGALGVQTLVDEKDIRKSAQRIEEYYMQFAASPDAMRARCLALASQYDWAGVTQRFVDVYDKVLPQSGWGR